MRGERKGRRKIGYKFGRDGKRRVNERVKDDEEGELKWEFVGINRL